jgi:xylan 1,4-beta-xylosidase
LNGSGWDPSLFHDDDGRRWLLNMVLDHRPDRCATAGIAIQELHPESHALVGKARLIFPGTCRGCTEAPRLYKRNGFYYLLTAEGGTSWNHAVTVARSTALLGPYQADPDGPLLSSSDCLDSPLQKAGHGSLVQTENDDWYLAHLCARPVMPQRRSLLGRETAIQKIRWTGDAWPRLDGGGCVPRVVVPAPRPEGGNRQATKPASALDDFDQPSLSLDWSTLRVPADESWLTLRARPSHLRLRGRESFLSQHRQSLVAKRLSHFRATVQTVVDFEPDDPRQAAGLICIYDTRDLLYLQLSWDEQAGKSVGLLQVDRGRCRRIGEPVALPPRHRCFLRADLDHAHFSFAFSIDGAQWTPIGSALDATQLSDEYGDKDGFTGAFVGLCAQDLTYQRKTADFDYFRYEARE